MIRAVALYACGEGQPPPELTYWFQWNTYGVLPNGGGLRDQRAGELQRMSTAKEAFDAWVAFHARAEGWEDLPINDATKHLFEGLEDLM